MDRERDGVMIGLGAGIMLVGLLILQSFIGSGLFSTRIGTTTVTSTATIQPPLNSIVYQWVYYLGAREVVQLSGMYALKANESWEGNAIGLVGIYNGRSNIMILFGETIGRDTDLTAEIADYNLTVVSQSETDATFSLIMNGTSFVGGNFYAEVNVSQEWSYSTTPGEGLQQWQIASETWNFMSLDYQSPPPPF